jgi:hypothetical protein
MWSASRDEMLIYLGGFLFAIGLLSLYRLNLQLEGREVWFSDAEYYLNQFFTRSSVDIFDTFDYISFLRLTILPIGHEALQINLTNSSLTILSAFLVSRIMDLKSHNLKWYLFMTIYNPFIVISLIRNFKDAYFIALSLVFLLLYQKINYLWVKALFAIMASFILFQIRPWAFLIFSILFLVDILLQKGRRLYALILLPVGIIAFYQFAWDYLLFWTSIVQDGVVEGFDLSYSNRLLGLFKLFTSPGLIRPLFPREYFLYSLCSVSVMVWFGQIVNYLALIRFFHFKAVIRIIKNHYHFAFYTCLPVVIYAIAYGGSVEFRIKATVLIPLFALLAKVELEKRHIVGYISTFILIVIVSSLMSV